VPLVRREDSVFVVVDAQPGFVAEEAGAKAVARIAWMAGLAALLDVPAVVVEEGPQRNGRTDPAILAHEAAVDAIRVTGRGTAVLTGFETDVCVAQSAIGLLELGFRAVVLEDAVYTNAAQEHERGIARMTGAGVERNHCKGLVFEWLHTVDRALEDFPQARALGTPPWRL
jgi:nicotinamidase-related amidase